MSITSKAGRPAPYRRARAAPARLGPADRPLRDLRARLRDHAGGGRPGLRAEPGRRAEPALPPLYVPLGGLERGGPGRGAGRAPLGGDGGGAGRAAALDPPLGLLPELSRQSGARAVARAPPGDPAALSPGGRPRRGRRARLRADRLASSRAAGGRLDLPRLRRGALAAERAVVPDQGWRAARHQAPRRLAAHRPADHRAPARHRDGARRVARPDALAAAAALREPGGPAGGLGPDAALPRPHPLPPPALPP